METMRRKRTRSIQCMCIEKIVGSGTFGIVYKAVDKTDPNRSEVALKRIKMERETQGFPVTAIREIKLLNMMRNHKNIVHLREIVTYEGNDGDREETLEDKKFEIGDIFMVFEFVDYDLSGILKSSGSILTEVVIRSYLYQLLEGLKYLHDCGILHRDIKSANLLITKHNVLKIADWGLARSIPEEKQHGSLKLTNPVVTLWYRSPEVIVGSKRYGKEVDIWSVGCIFGEMKTRTAMFRGETEAAQLDIIFQLTGNPERDTLARYAEIEGWSNFKISDKNKDCFASKYGGKLLDTTGLDLLQKLLDIDPTTRITADQALNHPYFTPASTLDPSRLEPISIAPVTEWMEQERARAEHERQRQQAAQNKQEKQQQEQQQLLLQQQQQQQKAIASTTANKSHSHMQKSGDKSIVGRFRIVKANAPANAAAGASGALPAASSTSSGAAASASTSKAVGKVKTIENLATTLLPKPNNGNR